MTEEKNAIHGLRKFFVPQDNEGKEALKETRPFLFLITAVMGFMYYQALTIPSASDLPRTVLLTLLIAIHTLVYWMIFYFVGSQRLTLYYLILQGTLVFMITLITNIPGLAIGFYGSLMGSTVGIVQNKRIRFFAMLFYFILAFVNVSVIANIAAFRELLPVMVPTVGFTVFFVVMLKRQMMARDKTRALLRELEVAHKQLTEYSLEVENLTLKAERQRMARELHDTLAQGLAGLILQLEAANSHLEEQNTTRSQEIIQQAMEGARTTLADARGAIDDLRSEQFEVQSLAEAITQEVERFRAATGIPCELNLDLPPQLDPSLSEHIQRAVVEGLNNIAQHAQAKQASITLSQRDEQIAVIIQDNGVGFEPDEILSKSGHYGIIGLRERSRFVSGNFEIHSEPGEGTQLIMRLPFQPAVSQPEGQV